jgi:hypothetical protein
VLLATAHTAHCKQPTYILTSEAVLRQKPSRSKKRPQRLTRTLNTEHCPLNTAN